MGATVLLIDEAYAIIRNVHIHIDEAYAIISNVHIHIDEAYAMISKCSHTYR